MCSITHLQTANKLDIYFIQMKNLHNQTIFEEHERTTFKYLKVETHHMLKG